MFSLMTGLWRYLFSKQEYNVLILGLDNSGKTTLLEELKRVKPSTSTTFEDEEKGKLGRWSGRNPAGDEDKPKWEVSPTVGLNVGRFEDRDAILRFWDLGGEKSLRSIWSRYYKDADALIFVVDSTDLERSAEAQQELNKLLQHADLSNIPVLVLGNKRDPLGKTISNLELAACLGIHIGGLRRRIRHSSRRATILHQGMSPSISPPKENPPMPSGSAIRRVKSNRILSTPKLQNRSQRIPHHRSKLSQPNSQKLSFKQLISPSAPSQTSKRPLLQQEIFLLCHFECREVHVMQTSVVRRRDLNHVIRFLCVNLAKLTEQKG